MTYRTASAARRRQSGGVSSSVSVNSLIYRSCGIQNSGRPHNGLIHAYNPRRINSGRSRISQTGSGTNSKGGRGGPTNSFPKTA